MPKLKDNYLLNGASGNMAKQYVYKKRGNTTHIAKMPKIRKDRQPTERQLEVRDLFGEASLYAKGAMANADLKKEYDKKATNGNTGYNVAFRDYLKAPRVKKIDTSEYNGIIGSTIVIHAKDDFRVASVKVSIHTAAGVLIEEGNAILNPVKLHQWIYTATQNNAAFTGCRVTAVAKDLPDNKGSLEVIV
jgi:hypothetical protein